MTKARYTLSIITKDRTPLNKDSAVYHFTSSGCRACYIGKTDRTLFERTAEHGGCDKENAIIKHLKKGQN